MKVAYNPNNGRVYRVLSDDFSRYKPGVPVALLEVNVVGNRQLLAALHDRPGKFVYDGTKFVETLDDGTQDWPVETKYEDSVTQFQAEFPTQQQALTAVSNITDLARAKSVMAKMVRAIYALARRTDMDITT